MKKASKTVLHMYQPPLKIRGTTRYFLIWGTALVNKFQNANASDIVSNTSHRYRGSHCQKIEMIYHFSV